MKILFLCTSNLHRSKTAEQIFAAKYPQHQFRSAGLSREYCEKHGTSLCTENLLDWADKIYVMETMHKERVEEHTGITYSDKIVVLNIPDEFVAMQPELIELLQQRVQIIS